MEKEIDPSTDGKTHINIYSKGKTALGRKLSNFSYRQFVHPKYGLFNSMEGFYYFVATGSQHEKLRRLHGIAAKRMGQKYPRITIKNFHEIMREGLSYSYLNDGSIDEMMLDQTINDKFKVLPFCHYYLSRTGEVVVPKGNEWLIEEWEKLRTYSLEKNGYTITNEDGDDIASLKEEEQ